MKSIPEDRFDIMVEYVCTSCLEPEKLRPKSQDEFAVMWCCPTLIESCTACAVVQKPACGELKLKKAKECLGESGRLEVRMRRTEAGGGRRRTGGRADNGKEQEGVSALHRVPWRPHSRHGRVNLSAARLLRI
jgi:hypothetical protein